MADIFSALTFHRKCEFGDFKSEKLSHFGGARDSCVEAPVVAIASALHKLATDDALR
jgi:hypothetical protein